MIFLFGRVLMLLRNRSRAVTKPNLMADHSSQQSSNNQNCAKKTIPSLFGSPKFVRDFTTTNNNSSLSEALKSPTSILDTKMLSPYGFGYPLFYDNKIQTVPNKTFSSRGIGLALIGNLKDDSVDENNSVEQSKGNVLFGTQLRVKVPTLPSPIFSPFESQTKTKDTKNSKLLSLSEMELCEEYTCVISHGPNPRTTHIFDNCVVKESYCSLPQKKSNSSYGNFLRVCYTCKKHLEQTKDIFIYRGEKAFCSRECRHREMVLDGVESLEEF